MTNLIQVSDLHFGRTDEKIVNALKDLINHLNPDVLVVSGDLTQRAKNSEFLQAQQFLNNFNCPKIIVPGNHDIPLYNLWRRFVKPYKKYSGFIEASLEPFYINEKVAIIGLNTSRSLAFKGGRISRKQLGYVKQKISSLDEKLIKILVTHHPLSEIGNKKVLKSLFEVRIDAFLSGHLHTNDIKSISHPSKNHAALVVQAGTATSVRYRGEPNNFNQLIIEDSSIIVQSYFWETEQYSKAKPLVYELGANGRNF